MPNFTFSIWDGRAKDSQVPFRKFSQEAPTRDQALAAVVRHYANIAKRRIEERMLAKGYTPPDEGDYSLAEEFKVIPHIIDILCTDHDILKARRERIIKP